MKSIYQFAQWALGIIFILSGLGASLISIISAIIFIGLGIFLLPPTAKVLEGNFNLKVSSTMKWVISIMSLIIGGYLIEPQNKDEPEKLEKSITNIEETKEVNYDSLRIVNEAKELDQKIERITKEIEGIKSFKGSDYRGDVQTLTIEVALFASWAKLANEAKDSEDKTLKKQGKVLLKEVTKLQTKEFPKIRADYAKFLKNKLWEEDIEVVCKRTAKTTLELTGRAFARNKTIKEVQIGLSQTLKDFRFKRINYKWNKYDDEYTYFIIDSEKDSKVVVY